MNRLFNAKIRKKTIEAKILFSNRQSRRNNTNSQTSKLTRNLYFTQFLINLQEYMTAQVRESRPIFGDTVANLLRDYTTRRFLDNSKNISLMLCDTQINIEKTLETALDDIPKTMQYAAIEDIWFRVETSNNCQARRIIIAPNKTRIEVCPKDYFSVDLGLVASRASNHNELEEQYTKFIKAYVNLSHRLELLSQETQEGIAAKCATYIWDFLAMRDNLVVHHSSGKLSSRIQKLVKQTLSDNDVKLATIHPCRSERGFDYLAPMTYFHGSHTQLVTKLAAYSLVKSYMAAIDNNLEFDIRSIVTPDFLLPLHYMSPESLLKGLSKIPKKDIRGWYQKDHPWNFVLPAPR